MNQNIITRTTTLSGKILLCTALSLSCGLPSFAQQVQFTDQDKQEAQDACVKTAGEKGFSLKEVVTVEPDTAQTDKLKIILNLDKEGQEYKLTCYYGADKVAMFDESEQPTEQTAQQPAQFTDQNKQEAQDACVKTAGEKGFTLKEVVSVEPDTVQTDKLKIILNLDKEGQEYKLTCYYGADKVAVFDEGEQPTEVAETPVEQPTEQTPVATTPPPAPVETRSGFPWWLLLIPLIGLPLLWFLMKGNDESTTTVTNETTSTNTYREPTTYTTTETPVVRRAWIRNNGMAVNVHSGPGTAYEITRTIPDDQELFITGRSEGDWIELESGGWVERRFFEVDSNYT